MAIRAYVNQSDPLGRSVVIGFLNEWDRGITAFKPQLGDAASEIRELREGDMFPEEYALRITSDQARALLESLVRFFNGAEDTRTLRRDYEHEKQRVDKALDALIGTLNAS